MTRFIDPTGHSTYGIGVCARCYRKFPLDRLMDDPNYPGLKVCKDDIDDYDPYRLPAREPDNINLEFVRPDVPIPQPTIPPVAPGDPGWAPDDSASPDGATYIKGT